MSEIDLAFLWHMHQPYYGDPVGNYYPMPWTRLHGIKGYYDMPLMLKEFPEIAFTINFTPSLMRQLRDYTDWKIYDEFFILSQKPALELNLSEKIFLLKKFFLCRKETMIAVYPAYQRLLSKRGIRAALDLERVSQDFTTQDYLDLQTWFNLSWFGFQALKEFPELVELKKKGHHFTEVEKLVVLDIQKKILAKLAPLYRSLWDEGRLEVSTTPFYHPILPLLCDSDIAREASPGIKLPVPFRWPQDANEQVKSGLEYMEQSLGRRPCGMWPSENAVSDQALKIIADNGVKWANTDERMLRKVLASRNRADLVYHPWCFQDTPLNLVFRDQEISDIISFNYSQLEAEVAVADFLRRMDGIKKQLDRLGRSRGLVLIALDGENPWESFPESGQSFLRTLFEKLSKAPGIRVQTVGKALEAYEPEKLSHLAPGTWINGNFEIWIGASEENQAWDYLGQVRKDAESLFKNASGEELALARSELFAAEGSDWFWWYGDDFFSEIDTEFDNIFRTHLKNVYLALGKRHPIFLEEPVKFDHPVKLTAKPAGFISPIIDGRETSFYEWQDAGYYDVLKLRSGYYSQEPHFSRIYFGFDSNNLYLRLDPYRPEDIKEDLEVEIRFEKPELVQIKFNYQLERQEHQKFSVIVCQDREECRFENDHIRKNKIFELAIPFSDLGFKPGQEAWFRIYVNLADRAVDRFPRDGLISFTVPDQDFETRMWTV
jgi:alpha-amylase/alpha-mannosidase (GH57 family)